MNNQQQLINFLRNLANDIENNSIEDENLLKISQFMMNFQFQNQQDEQSDDYSRDDMVKFLSLGWYIYTQLLNQDEDLTHS